VCIFNTKTNTVRYTMINLTENWGGHGRLGCEFGSGILNQLSYLKDAN